MADDSSMTPPSPRPSPRPLFSVAGAFVLVALLFVAAAFVTERRASLVDGEAEQIETNALPSVEDLAAARDALWHLELATEEYAEGRTDARAAMDLARSDLARALAAELATGQYPGEAAYDVEVQRSLEELDRTLARVPSVAADGDGQARAFVRRECRERFGRADEALHRLMVLNASEAHAAVLRIGRVREDTVRLSFALTAGCLLFAVGAGVIALRALRREREIEAAHQSLLSARSSELERFASRVAHDLLSPLSALHFTLSSLRRNVEKGLPVADSLARAEACLKRSQSLVDGVMDFARSGAAPTAARANLADSVQGVIEEARAESSGVDFVVIGVDEATFVACSPGVLASVLSNLVRNAVKYMDGESEARVTVRAELGAGRVHVAIEDTGPGLPPGLEAHVFEPYVRGPDNPKPGLGLGLATVHSFVTAHGGRVGVKPSPRRGCTFWFDMPRAS